MSDRPVPWPLIIFYILFIGVATGVMCYCINEAYEAIKGFDFNQWDKMFQDF